MKIKAYADFSGGYTSDLPDVLMKENMLRTAENVFWRNGLRKREGYVAYGESGLSGCEVIQGLERAYMNSAWTTIVAMDDGSDVYLYQDNGTAKTFVVIDDPVAFTLTTDNKVKFTKAKVDGEDVVIGVNGVDKPFIIYYDSGFNVKTLESYDERTRTDDDWYAGLYDASETNAYIDDTTDAQDAGADDFVLASTTNNDGFYIAGILTYTKVVITSASQFDGSPVASYQYYKGDDTWGSLSMVSTPTWTAAAGDRTLEFNYPTDWVAWDGSDSVDGEGSTIEGAMSGRWVIRVRFTTAPSTQQTADDITIYHTQYLTQIMDGDIPHEVCTHNSRVIFAAGPNINYSPYGQVTGWATYSTEYFTAGGDKIMKMVSLGDVLTIFKGSAIFSLSGNTYDSWTVRQLTGNVGTINGDTVAVIGQVVFFLGNDKMMYAWNGQMEKRISKHIETDLSGYTTTNANAIAYDGDYWISFPDDSIILRMDPDTFRVDDGGEGYVSFFKYTGITASQMIYFSDNSDTRELISAKNLSTPAGTLIQLEDGNYYDETATAITMKVQTKDLTFGTYQKKKRYTRVKPDIEQAEEWTITLLANDGEEELEVTVQSGTDSGHYSEDISVPYTIDGKDFAVKFENTSDVYAAVYGVALEYEGRVF